MLSIGALCKAESKCATEEVKDLGASAVPTVDTGLADRDGVARS
jgi:hypothetical protein